MQNKFYLILLLLNVLTVFSQKEKIIQGKIVVKDSKLEGIRVINLVNEKEAITDAHGSFSILAKPKARLK